jgi:hypothetical protein
MPQNMLAEFSDITPYVGAGIELFKSAAAHQMVEPVGKTFTYAVGHSNEFTKVFFEETDKLMHAFSKHHALPHVLSATYQKSFQNPDHFSTMTHAFDSTSLTESLEQYKDNLDSYNHLIGIFRDNAIKSPTASPLINIGRAVTRRPILDWRAQHQNHPLYNIVSKRVLDVAAVTKNVESTLLAAEISYRHIKNPGMHEFFEHILKAAKIEDKPHESVMDDLEFFGGSSKYGKAARTWCFMEHYGNKWLGKPQ